MHKLPVILQAFAPHLLLVALVTLLILSAARLWIMGPWLVRQFDVISASLYVLPRTVAMAKVDIPAGKVVGEADLKWISRNDNDDRQAPLGSTRSDLFERALEKGETSSAGLREDVIGHKAVMAIPAKTLVTKLAMGQDPDLARLLQVSRFDPALEIAWIAMAISGGTCLFLLKKKGSQQAEAPEDK